MTVAGVDSLSEPTVTDAKVAARAGVKWWGGYIGGAGAAGVWTPSGWKALKEAGITPLPIWVPDQSLDGNPVAEAKAAMVAVTAAGLGHVVALDTEHSATGNPRLESFVNAWNRTLAAAGWKSVVYDGAGYAGQAAAWRPDWNGDPATSSGDAVQYAGAVVAFGLNVDLDSAGSSLIADIETSALRIVVGPAELGRLASLMDDAGATVTAGRVKAAFLRSSLLQTLDGHPAEVGTRQLRDAVAVLDRVLDTAGLPSLGDSLDSDSKWLRHLRLEALRADASHHPRSATGVTVID